MFTRCMDSDWHKIDVEPKTIKVTIPILSSEYLVRYLVLAQIFGESELFNGLEDKATGLHHPVL